MKFIATAERYFFSLGSRFVLAGFAATAAAWHKHNDQTVLFPNWLPVAVFIAVMTVTVSLWQAFVVQDIKHSPHETNVEIILHYSLLPFGFLLALALGISLHLIRFAWIKNHEALAALYQSRLDSQKNTALLLNTGDGIHVLDKQARLVEVSNSFCDLLGLSRNEILGKHISEFIVDASGGEVLKKVASIFKEVCRDTDVISRIGGDEFAILLVHPTDHDSAKRVADRIIASFAEPLWIGVHEIKVTLSIGISMYPDDGEDIEALRKTADLALYKTKSLGRNDYTFYQS